MKHIKSPINYTGNKYRLLEQLKRHIPKETRVFVDLFCGGATVGFNVNAEKIILIDSNKQVINLLKFLAKSDYDVFVKKLEAIIKKYNLSYSAKNGYSYYKNKIKNVGNNGLKEYNKEGFYKLREEYNNIKNKSSDKAQVLLYMLMVYGFNNDLRFNSLGGFNLPVGKTDLNKNNLNKIKEYTERAKEINYEFICSDFTDPKVKDILINQADFIYADPPYLITDAVYNENDGWNIKKEHELLDVLKNIKDNNKKFALSNVISKRDAINMPLTNWVEQHNDVEVVPMEYHYRSSSYNKIDRLAGEQEVIVKTKENL